MSMNQGVVTVVVDKSAQEVVSLGRVVLAGFGVLGQKNTVMVMAVFFFAVALQNSFQAVKSPAPAEYTYHYLDCTTRFFTNLFAQRLSMNQGVVTVGVEESALVVVLR